MVVVASNVEKVLKKFEKYRTAIKLTIDQIAEKLAKSMVDDMLADIEQQRPTWLQPNGNLERVDNIGYNISKLEDGFIRITLGENLPLIRTGNTKYSLENNKHYTWVNPLYFIEFGFGVLGENNPKEGTNRYDWIYNTNEHGRETENPYTFKGLDGQLVETEGGEGINFLYNTIQKYRNSWKDLLLTMVKESL
jgi:hypothetical protein